MEYTFTIRRRTGIALLAGLALCFGLTFLAGWMVGLNSQMAQLAADTTATRSEAPSEKEGGMRASEPPAEPVPTSPRADSVRDEQAAMPGGEPDDPAAESASRPDTTVPAPTQTDTGQVSTRAPFTIQVGGYADRANAQRVAQRIRSKGETVFVQPEQRNGDLLYQVWVGRYATRAAADRRLEAVGDYTGSAFVTRMEETP